MQKLCCMHMHLIAELRRTKCGLQGCGLASRKARKGNVLLSELSSPGAGLLLKQSDGAQHQSHTCLLQHLHRAVSKQL